MRKSRQLGRTTDNSDHQSSISQAKFKTMLDKHGYRLEGNRVVLSDPNTTPPPSKLSRIQTTPKTPKSASATKRKDTTNGSADDPTPTKKKKKAAPKSEALVVEEKPDNTESDSVVKDEAT